MDSLKTLATLDQFMPEYKLRQIDRVRLAATASEAWPVIRNLDTFELPISKFLFSLRSLPDVIRGKEESVPQHSRIDDFAGPDKGFKVLSEISGREIVIGSIGKFWKPHIAYANFSTENFKEFNSPGFGKLVWNLKIDPDLVGGCWLTWELRVTSTDEESWKHFRKYWLVIGSFSHMLRRMALKVFEKKLSANDEEKMKLSGDAIIQNPLFQKTMAVTIEKSPKEVWPWLVQMGCRRAGWYSIDLLDNGGKESAWRIIPELQNLKVGDVLPTTPKGKTGFVVRSIEFEKSLVVSSPPLGEKGEKLPASDSWAFVLEPIGENATRLITRVRAEYKPSVKTKIFEMWISPVHYIMEKVQLKNIKLRVENPPRSNRE